MSENVLKVLPLNVQEEIFKINDIVEKIGYTSYIIGGMVRDWILNKPINDIDIVILGDATLVAKEYEKKYNVHVKIFSRFYTATIPLRDNDYKNIDLISTRKEIYEKPGDLPIVEKGTLKDDLYRRDFTINTLGLDMQRMELVDIYDGKKDIYNKKIRILYPESFIDDPTRILRAIRFKNRYDFNYERCTHEYMIKSIYNDNLNTVSKDRIKKELSICLEEEKAYKILQEFMVLKIFKKIFFIEELSKQKIVWLQEINKYTKKEDKILVMLLIIFFNVDKKSIEKFCQYYHLSKDKNNALLHNTEKFLRVRDNLNKQNVSSFEIFKECSSLLAEEFPFMELYSTDYPLIKEYLHYYKKELASVQIKTTGNHLMMLGIVQGPIYKEIFNELLENKINFGWRTLKEELEYLKVNIEKWR